MAYYTGYILDSDCACFAQPAAFRDGGDAVTGLVNTEIARVAEYHVVRVFAFSLQVKREGRKVVRCVREREEKEGGREIE